MALELEKLDTVAKTGLIPAEGSITKPIEGKELETKEAPTNVVRAAEFIVAADKVVLEEVKKPEGEDEKEVEAAIDSMLARWFRSTSKAVEDKDLDDLKTLAKKMYYERLNQGESRGVWRVLREHITGQKSEMI